MNMNRVVNWVEQRIITSFQNVQKPKLLETSCCWKSNDYTDDSRETEIFDRPNSISNSNYCWSLNTSLVSSTSYLISATGWIPSLPAKQKLISTLLTNKRRMSTLRSKMEKVEDIVVGHMPASQYLKPLRMTFKQNGIQRYWDFMKLHESVSCIIFNKSRNVVVLVSQFRPAVYFGNIPQTLKNPKSNPDPTSNQPSLDIDWAQFPTSNGITLEMCAGIVDNPDLSPAEIAKQEVYEECGYDVPISNFELVTNFVSGVGVSGETQTMYYCEVTDAMKTGKGGGLVDEGELIEVVEMTIPDLKNYVKQPVVKSPSSFLFGMTWFLLNKVDT